MSNSGHRRYIQRHGGFSLLEVLVAFTLMALIVVVLMRVFSGGLQGISLAEDYARASSIAESMLARVGADVEIKEGSTTGEVAGRYRWTIAVVPQRDEPGANQQPGQSPFLLPVMLHRVDVTVLWEEYGRERRIQLSTLRLGPRA